MSSSFSPLSPFSPSPSSSSQKSAATPYTSVGFSVTGENRELSAHEVESLRIQRRRGTMLAWSVVAGAVFLVVAGIVSLRTPRVRTVAVAYASGKPKEVGNFIAGRRFGEFKSFYENGQTNEIGQYDEDQRVGIWQKYFWNGQLAEEGYYERDMKVGVWQTYYGNGNRKAIEKHPAFSPTSYFGPEEYRAYPAGTIASWYESGQLEEHIFFGPSLDEHDGRRTVLHQETFYENGQMSSAGVFVDRHAEGWFSYWHENGRLMGQVYYEDGEAVVEGMQWNEDGTLMDQDEIRRHAQETSPPTSKQNHKHHQQ